MLQYLGLDPLLTQDQHYTLLKDTFSLAHMVHRCRVLAVISKAMWATSRFFRYPLSPFLVQDSGQFILVRVFVVITLKYLHIAIFLLPLGNRVREILLDERNNTQHWRWGVVALPQVTKIILWPACPTRRGFSGSSSREHATTSGKGFHSLESRLPPPKCKRL